jgi:hypothetical protein
MQSVALRLDLATEILRDRLPGIKIRDAAIYSCDSRDD